MIFSKGIEGNLVTLSFLTSSTRESNSREGLSRLEREYKENKNEG